MNSPIIYFDPDNHALFVQWRNRSNYQRFNAAGELTTVKDLPSFALELNTTDGWQEAFSCGFDEGQSEGYAAGYEDGYVEGLAIGRDGEW